jgi:HAD superfamily hydrolase (TIGR01484 family)
VLTLAEFPPAARGAVHTLLFDIDDTLTTDGRLTAEAYAALDRAHAGGLATVPVTGRPAGWCDHIARMWPVAGVVGENGAFYFRYDRSSRRMVRRFVDDGERRAGQRLRLQAIAEEIVRTVPGAAVAADQPYRESDLAIDWSEDVPPLGRAEVERIADIMARHGLTAKVSSIHVNGWFGHYDKLATSRRFIEECLGFDPEAERSRCVFIGDSPNDAPMFGYFPHAIGVANVLAFAGRLAPEPCYVTRAAAGAGFREAVDCILDARRLSR